VSAPAGRAPDPAAPAAARPNDGTPSAGRRMLGQILKARGIVREGQIQEAIALQRKQGGLIGQCLIELKHCTAKDVAHALAEQAGLEAVDLAQVKPEKAALALIDASTAHTYGVLPLRIEGSTLVVAIADPLNTAVLEDLRFTTGVDVRAKLGDADALKQLVLQHYGEEQSLKDAIADAARAVSGTDVQSAAASTPVVRLLNSILHRAIKDRASDIHFEVFESEFRIRYRVDGSLYEVEAPPGHLALPLVARIKVMSDLDITEVRMPQDGRIELSIDGRPVDLRVATLPGISGEGCVMRVLDRSAVSLDLEALGLQLVDRERLMALTRLPHGIVLVTGPTGSGKTTTLYAMLAEANQPDVKIITTEDPVEYDIEGIVQVPINDDIGVTYARVLRTVLRQDPDKILIGEIRDAETASVAVEASLTGHTVFSTLHTNDAPSTVTRLVDMGVEPFMITATLEAVVAQRLVRTICNECKTAYQPGDEVLMELGSDAEKVRGARFFYGSGCERCHHTGYKGRTGIFEILTIDDALRAAILARASTQEVRRLAITSGMRSLRESGLGLVVAGRTTIEEVLRETTG
jgi:type IV pilus assembly protein PilB